MKVSQFKRDAGKVERGVWIDLGDGARLRVASMASVGYQNRIAQLQRPLRHLIRRGRADPAVLKDVLLKAVSETVLLGWDGLQDADGTAIPYTPEKALELLREYEELADLVVDSAQDPVLFREEETLEESRGN